MSTAAVAAIQPKAGTPDRAACGRQQHRVFIAIGRFIEEIAAAPFQPALHRHQPVEQIAHQPQLNPHRRERQPDQPRPATARRPRKASAPAVAKTIPAVEIAFGETRRAASLCASARAQRVSRDFSGRRLGVTGAETTRPRVPLARLSG